ncbi:MAG: formylglycine-generating enzyme family protein [Candidatus Sumerlaeaceae bacterium]|nr:formylglycine-generating enzyme family protein [Candidatus Sumerlaeaceae bacterium]
MTLQWIAGKLLRQAVCVAVVTGASVLPLLAAPGDITTFTLPGNVPLEMVEIPQGSFEMGAPNDPVWNDTREQPVHTVNFGYTFHMGKVELTQAQWLAIMGDWPDPVNRPGNTCDPSTTCPCIAVGDDYPAYYISFKDVHDPAGFLAKLNKHIVDTGQAQGGLRFRLPSEAEWEYSCRAGTSTRYNLGDTTCDPLVCTTCTLDDLAWFCGNAASCSNPNRGPHPVGTKLPNAFGLFDMHGNVYEWCEDQFLLTYSGAPTDGSAYIPWPYEDDRQVRGGSWYTYPKYCRSTFRWWNSESSRRAYLGVRLVLSGPRVLADDNFTTDVQAPTPGDMGWYYNANNTVGTTADALGGALRIGVPTRPDASHYHVTSWVSNLSEWIPYNMVRPGYAVRAKFYVYAGGQSPNTVNCIPNIRMKLQHASAIATTLEVLATSNNATEDARGAELAPSRDETKPSLYRVDYEPIDIPYLKSNAGPQGYGGFMRSFENYSFYPQMNGNIFLAESQVITYPAHLLTNNWALSTSATYTKTYAAAELQNFENTSETFKVARLEGLSPGVLGNVFTTPPLPTITHGSNGLTLSSVGFPSTAVAICEANLSPVPKPGAAWLGSDYASVPRVEENRQYKIRFHVVSSRQSNQQSQLRLRARSDRFLWGSKLEIGGAYPTNSPINMTIAQQILPGIGCLNPNTGGEPAGTDGGWYTLIFHSPLSIDIRPDVPGDIFAKMPFLANEPGPGSGTIGNTRRMIFLGMDLIDTLSTGAAASLEAGSFTLDAIELKTYELFPD